LLPIPQVRPTKQQCLAAQGRTVPDIIAPDLRILFCGINTGLYSAAVQHHFARPGNRFWPALFAAGLTPRLLAPADEREMLALGLGITNVVDRATAAAAELRDDELRAGAETLEAKVRRYEPRVLAILGVGAYRVGFGRQSASVGPQDRFIARTRVWVLPNPSGLNAHYQARDLADVFRSLGNSIA
jgi:TDG/mug DNA glycosylase family protein